MSETSLSTYPTTVDSFDRLSDLNATTLAKAEIYKGYIDAGEYATAASYLADSDNSDLKACGISANGWNKITDAVVALEETLDSTLDYLYDSAIPTLQCGIAMINNTLLYYYEDVAVESGGVLLTDASKQISIAPSSGVAPLFTYDTLHSGYIKPSYTGVYRVTGTFYILPIDTNFNTTSLVIDIHRYGDSGSMNYCLYNPNPDNSSHIFNGSIIVGLTQGQSYEFHLQNATSGDELTKSYLFIEKIG